MNLTKDFNDIKEDTITIAVDTMGGDCHRLMLGTQGIINNAGCSLSCWKFNAPDDKDIQDMKYPTDLDDALALLSTDNFSVYIVEGVEQVRELLQDKELELDLNNIEFKNGMYNIY